jgi:hypothetical protein
MMYSDYTPEYPRGRGKEVKKTIKFLTNNGVKNKIAVKTSLQVNPKQQLKVLRRI